MQRRVYNRCKGGTVDAEEENRCRGGWTAGAEEEGQQVQRKDSRCKGGTAGEEEELVLGMRVVESGWKVLGIILIGPYLFPHLFCAVRLIAPHSLQVLHIETRRCNISWEVSQVSHYVNPYLEFEARRRLLDRSWEVRNGQVSAFAPSCSGVYLCLFLHAGVQLIHPGSTCWCATDSAWFSYMA